MTGIEKETGVVRKQASELENAIRRVKYTVSDPSGFCRSPGVLLPME